MGFEEFNYLEFASVAPEILLTVWGTIVLAADLMSKGGIKRKTLGWFAGVGMVAVLAFAWFMRPDPNTPAQLGGMIRNDVWTWAFRVIFILGGALTCVASADFRSTRAGGEYYALIIFSSMAMCLMAASTDIIMLYLATETASLALYLMAGFQRGNKLSVEAGIKYFVFGAVTSTVMLFGLSLLFGLSGSTSYGSIAQAVRFPDYRVPVVFASLLTLVGFAFKMSAFPFHFWAPDVYQGSPTPIAGFISTASKAAGFAILMRFFQYALPETISVQVGAGNAEIPFIWVSLLRPIAILTLLIGSFSALAQTNVKRMLAYSSVAQAGYVLIGVAAFASLQGDARAEAAAAVLFYLATYMITNIAAFTVAGVVSQKMGGDDFKDFAGLGRKAPYLAYGMTAALLSLLGAPPAIGFIGKLFIFRSAIGAANQAGAGTFDYYLFLLMVVIGVLMVLVSVFYYLGVVRAMFVERAEGDTKPMLVPTASSAVVLVTGVASIIAITVVSGYFWNVALDAARSFLGLG
jgi:NADH-quinone oxidoreductase subunit N